MKKINPVYAIAAVGVAGALAMSTAVIAAMPSDTHPVTHTVTHSMTNTPAPHPEVAMGTKPAPEPKPEPTDTATPSTKAKVKPATTAKRLSAPLPVSRRSSWVSAPTPDPTPQKPSESASSSSPTPTDKPSPPTWSAADDAAARRTCITLYGPDSRPLSTPAIGEPKNPDVLHYACTQPIPPRKPGTQAGPHTRPGQ